jgi:hypothetical protein
MFRPILLKEILGRRTGESRRRHLFRERILEEFMAQDFFKCQSFFRICLQDFRD